MKDTKAKEKKKKERKQITKRLEFERVMETLDIIDEMLANGASLDDIKREIEIRIYSSMGYVEKSFKAHVGCTITQYIRAYNYVTLFRKWNKMKPSLTKKETYEGCDNFKQNIKRGFGVDLEVVSEKDILFNIKFDRKTLEFIDSKILTQEWVDSYEFVNGELTIKNKPGKTLEHLMTYKTYFIHKNFKERVKWNDLEKDIKKAILIGLNYAQDKDSHNKDRIIPYDEFSTEMKALDLLYDIDNPIKMGDWFIYASDIWEPLKYEIPQLMGSCEEERFYLTYPEEIPISNKWASYRLAFDSNDTLLSLIEVIKKYNMNIEQMGDLYWEMIVKGFIRIKKK